MQALHQHAIGQLLPPEILVHILEHTRPNAHRSLELVSAHVAHMSRYSLVCRNWAKVAQQLLFRLVITSGDRNVVLLEILGTDLHGHAVEKEHGTQDMGLYQSARPSKGPDRTLLASWIDKLELQTDPGSGSDDSLAVIASILRHCNSLRHFSLHVQSRPYAGGDAIGHDLKFAESALPHLEELTHLSVLVFANRCHVVRQMVSAWPSIRFLDLGGTMPYGYWQMERIHPPPALRSLRLLSSYRFPIAPVGPTPRFLPVDPPLQDATSTTAAVVPLLQRLAINLSNIPMTDFHPIVLKHVKCLILHISSTNKSPITGDELVKFPAMMPALEELIILSSDFVPAYIIDALHSGDFTEYEGVLNLRIRHLGLQWSLKRHDDLFNLARRLGTQGGLQRLTLWECESWDVVTYSNKLQEIKVACLNAGLELALRTHDDLWDVPIRL
ncbi:hypothetical protein BKA62DRAFT_269358 [Auriculariales sp. MPI-PUGE-AT-0066]|nr:hypothetical protein BKA62DRAFT_269358 [Auriculariales sp. MPI-PUGE-AT-0066]